MTSALRDRQKIRGISIQKRERVKNQDRENLYSTLINTKNTQNICRAIQSNDILSSGIIQNINIISRGHQQRLIFTFPAGM